MNEDLETAEQWEEISSIFHSIVELPLAKRARALSAISDEKKRLEIEKLLAADDAAAGFISVSPLSAAGLEQNLPPLPARIGKYKILREIGRGGMGTVYLAEREDLKKRVALKIIKRGMDTDEILRRFQTERQILSNLEHPNIARLLDGGVSEENLSFLVMEYVGGEDLISFCGNRDLSFDGRLELFRKICAAVAHAHQNLIVHRDLKPSNILVTEAGEPKLLDFGISKILTADAENATGTATAFGMMTPNYASPEQFRGETVSTATDIYSLGVILFELLTGKLPYETSSKKLEEAARVVSENEPPRPSIVVSESWSASRNAVTDDSAAKKTNSSRSIAAANPKLLRGDLDNIILKALRKEPARRYSTVEQFSEDIHRHLSGLPVTARPDTFSYRASKFINRNKFSVGSAALVALALVGGIAGTSWQAVRAERERGLAQKRFGEVRQLANNAVFKYYEQIKDLDGATEARETLVKDATEYLDRLAQDASGDVSLQRDLVKAYFRLGDVLGAPYTASNTGDTAGALANYRKAETIINNLIADFPQEVEFIGLKRNLHTKIGEVHQRGGNADETRENFRAAMELSRKIVETDPNNPTHLSALGQNYVLYGETLPLGTGENESVATASQGLPYLEKALAIAPNESVPLQRMNMANIRIGLQIYGLAREAEDRGDRQQTEELYNRAAEQFEKATATAEKLVAIDGKNAGFMRRLFISKFNKSTALSGLGQTDVALEMQNQMLAQTEKAAKETANAEAQLDLAQTFYELARTAARRKEYSAAAGNFRQAIEIYSQIITKDAHNSEVQKSRFEARLRLGDALAAQENEKAAIEQYQTALAEAKDAPQLKNTPFVAFADGWTRAKIGDLAARKNDLQNARAEYRKAAENWRNENSAPEKFGFSRAMLTDLQAKLQR